jgi:transcriptional regulator with XRE-family HTH domain
MPATFNAERFSDVAAAKGDKTIEQIAARTGLDIGVISRLLRSERQPRLATITRAADAYDVPVDDLIRREAAA